MTKGMTAFKEKLEIYKKLKTLYNYKTEICSNCDWKNI